MAGVFLSELQHFTRTAESGKLWVDPFDSEYHSWGWHELSFQSQLPLRYSGEETVSSMSYWDADILVEWFPQHKYIAVGITSAGAAVGRMDTVSNGMHFPLTVW